MKQLPKYYYLIESKVNYLLYEDLTCNLIYSGIMFSKDINKRRKYLIKLIGYIVNPSKINDSTHNIIEENLVQFSKALYADFEDRHQQTSSLVKNIIHKFHLY